MSSGVDGVASSASASVTSTAGIPPPRRAAVSGMHHVDDVVIDRAPEERAKASARGIVALQRAAFDDARDRLQDVLGLRGRLTVA